MKQKLTILFAAFLVLSNYSIQAQTTVSLSSQCNCEVTSGAADPTGACTDAGALYINTTSGAIFYCDGSAWQSSTAGSEPWFGTDDDADATSNTENIYHLGNVGIGTTDPQVDLQVPGATLLRNWAIADNAPSQVSSAIGARAFLDYSGGASPANGQQTARVNTYAGVNLGLGTSENTHLFIASNANFRDGNVGINTEEPDARLHVLGNGTDDTAILEGSVRQTRVRSDGGLVVESKATDAFSFVVPEGMGINSGGDAGSYINFHGDTTDPLRDARITRDASENGDWTFLLEGTGEMTFQSDNAGGIVFKNGTDRTITLVGDQVGIGTSTPSEKLEVVGNILASGTITPDYVFETHYDGVSTLKPSYKIMSLEQVEAFTQMHKHLPGVPSAAEVTEKGGIVINRQSEIQLEKIEELFLHTIEQNKQIKNLEAKNAQLIERLEAVEALLSGMK